MTTIFTTLTAFELAVLTAIDNSEYGSMLRDEIWSSELAGSMPANGPTKRAISGVVSSLAQKGLVHCQGDGREQTVGMTAAGAALYLAANGGKSRKP